MRLSECGAHFFDEWKGRKGIGLMFYCPLCVKAGLPKEDCVLLPVNFKNPIDGGPPMPIEVRRWEENGVKKEFTLPQWQRSGETIDTLTMSPSINADQQKHEGHTGWHGHIQNGMIVGGGV